MAVHPYLTFEDGLVTVGDTELPGLLVSLTISKEVKFDEAKSDGKSGKKKTPMGFEDAKINMEMELLTDDDDAQNAMNCYEKLAEIEKLFTGVSAKAAPKILTVTNKHLRARKVEKVVFSGLASRESNEDDIVVVALTFTEHTPPITRTEKRVVGGKLQEQKDKAAQAEQAKNAPPAKPNEKVIPIDTNAGA